MSERPVHDVSPYAPPHGRGKAGRRPSARLIPPWWVWIVAASCAVAITFLRISNVTSDHAVDNILTLICGFVAASSLACWFVFRSGYSRGLRSGSVVGLLAALLLCCVLFKIDQVSGELVPVLRLRWNTRPDKLLDVPASPSGTAVAELITTSARDYPQFLGPDRNGKVAGVQLLRNWDVQPPRLLWRQPIGAGWSAFSAVNGFAVTMEQRGDSELVTCYEVKTGKLVWSHAERTRHTTTLGGVGPRSTPTIDNGKVFTLGATGALLCLDGGTGEVLWRDDLLHRYGVEPAEDTQSVAWGRSASPLIVEDLLVVGGGGPAAGPHVSLVAFDKNTGELLWEGGQRQVAFSSPTLATLAGVRQIISVNQDFVSGHDVQNGQVLWETEWPGKSNANANVSQPVALSADHLLLSKGYGVGAALFKVTRSPDSGSFSLSEIWRNNRVLKTKFANVVVQDGYAYGLSDGILECVRLQDGQRQWKRGRYGHGQLLGVGDVLLVQAEAGQVALVEASPARFYEIASLPALSGKTWNNPCLYQSYLLVRNAEEACCFELPSRSVELGN